MGFSIRPATNADVKDVVRVIRAVYDEFNFTWDEGDYHADLYDLQAHYLDQGHRFWVGIDEETGETVGTIALELFPALPGEAGQTTDYDGKIRAGAADCSIERLYVHPNGRRGGLGRALMQVAMDEAARDGRKTLEMWSDKRFEDAHRLYQKLGAEIVGERICHDPDQSPEWGLVIRLS